jgi:hypothetical protein
MKIRTAVGAVLAPIALIAATGCSPDQIKQFVYANMRRQRRPDHVRGHHPPGGPVIDAQRSLLRVVAPELAAFDDWRPDHDGCAHDDGCACHDAARAYDVNDAAADLYDFAANLPAHDSTGCAWQLLRGLLDPRFVLRTVRPRLVR